MSPVRPESPANPDLQAEISAMNREFLSLLTHPAVDGRTRLLGLSPDVIDSLRRMSVAQLDQLATAPLLLAGFALLPGAQRYPLQAAGKVAESHVSPDWSDCALNYANRLLTSLWHYSRQPDGITGFCMGLDPAAADALANMDFVELCECARVTCASLHARHADHPACWPDLVNGVLQGHGKQLSVAHLSLIPLTVATQFAARA